MFFCIGFIKFIVFVLFDVVNFLFLNINVNNDDNIGLFFWYIVVVCKVYFFLLCFVVIFLLFVGFIYGLVLGVDLIMDRNDVKGVFFYFIL